MFHAIREVWNSKPERLRLYQKLYQVWNKHEVKLNHQMEIKGTHDFNFCKDLYVFKKKKTQ